MFKETKTEKTSEQQEAEKYQQRLDEVRQAVDLERKVLAPLSSSIDKYSGDAKEFEKALKSLDQLRVWLSDSNVFDRISVRDLTSLNVYLESRRQTKVNRGIPNFFAPLLIFPDYAWKGNNNDDDDGVRYRLMVDRYHKDVIKETNGLFIPANRFFDNSDNPFSVTGVLVSVAGEEKFNTVHEGMHLIDFYSGLRTGINQIISEIISFRQEKFIQGFSGYDWASDLIGVLDNYFLDYGLGGQVTVEDKQSVIKAMRTIERLDEKIGILPTTHILLNSLNLDSINQWSELNDEELVRLKNEYV
jgi:hypothetical protein